MQIALISDIHANLIALEAVLADIDQIGADQIIFLGDLATLGPQPQAVVARLRDLGCPCIMGNHDAVLVNLPRLHQDGHADWYIKTVEWSVEQLSADDFDYLRSFEPLLTIQLDPADPETTLLCCHGSPKSNTDQIWATTPAAELDAMLAGYEARVVACAHTHLQMMRRRKGMTVVNSGSVGAPFEYVPVQIPATGWPRMLPWAEYAIVSWVKGRLGIELRQVPVDLDAIRAVALASDNPHAVSWVEMW